MRGIEIIAKCFIWADVGSVWAYRLFYSPIIPVKPMKLELDGGIFEVTETVMMVRNDEKDLYGVVTLDAGELDGKLEWFMDKSEWVVWPEGVDQPKRVPEQ